MNSVLFRATMVKNEDTQDSLAKALGMSRSCLNAKINGKGTEFRQNEILFIKERYHLTASEIDSIFFNVKVS